jgi:hypothetical protein
MESSTGTELPGGVKRLSRARGGRLEGPLLIS